MGQIIDSILAPARPDGLLFHYTTQKGLLGILESKAIWATHIRYLNDGAEFWHTLELAQTELEMRKRVNARNGELIEMIEQLISHISASVPEVYVTSFSTKQDQLSQWRAYCPRGGFCLGFEADIIHSYAEKERFILSQCVYDKNIQSGAIKELFDDFFSLLEQPAQISMPMGATSEDRSLTLKRFYQSEFLSPLMQLAARFKNASFEAENEWRLISQTKFNGGAICLREGPFTLIPYVVLKLAEKGEALAIHTICVGPTPYRELAINAVKRLFPVQNAPVWQMSKTTFRPDW